MTAEENALYDMSNEELAEAVSVINAEIDSPDTVIEEEAANTAETDSEIVDEVDEIVDELDTVDELEQPNTDSEDDTSDDDDTEEETNKDSDTADDNLDGDENVEEEQPEVVENKVEVEAQPPKTYKYKAVGQEFEFTEDEIKAQFGTVFGQAMDYTKKMQKMKPDMGKLDIINQGGLTEEQLNLAVDLMKGDVGAINNLLKRTGIDALSLDEESNAEYKLGNYGRSEDELNLREVEDRLGSDPEYATTYDTVIKHFDAASKETFTKKPKFLESMHTDVKNGVYPKVNEMAQKRKLYSPDSSKSDLDFYIEAANEYETTLRLANTNKAAQEAQIAQDVEKQRQVTEKANAEQAKIAKVKADTVKREANKVASKKRKAATSTKGVVATNAAVNGLFDNSEEEYQKWSAALEAAR